MALHVTAWAARLFGSTGHLMYLPFDKDFRTNESGRDNHIPLKLIGARPFWYIFVDFPTMDPGNPDYPHAVEVHDNDDFGTIEFGAHWSERAGTNEGYGPIPTAMGKHRVRLVLLNRDRRPLLSQSGDYYVDAG